MSDASADEAAGAPPAIDSSGGAAAGDDVEHPFRFGYEADGAVPPPRNGAARLREEVAALSAAFADDHGTPAVEAVRRLSEDVAAPLPGEAPARKKRKKPRVWTTYKERVAGLSDAIVRAQKPIRILDAVKWGDDVIRDLVKHRFQKLPRVGRTYYRERQPLRFDPAAKIEEFERIKRRIERQIGAGDALGNILLRTAEQYQMVVRMLEARGSHEFYRWSRELYGTPKEKFIDEQTTIRDLGRMLYDILAGLEELDAHEPEYQRSLSADDVVKVLNKRFEAYFHDHHVHARLDDGIVSDAAAGADYIKIKSGVAFSPRDVDMLEVHEGWAHVGTTINGQCQHVASWLAKGPPRTTAVQEGLAALVEILTFRSTPRRAKKLNDRILAVDKAEDGASFLDVFEWFRTEGYDEEECFHNT
ncbi:MAG TPA: tyrosine/phenylalanine carboxypeptidase domain-containing protein, partial [Planctomycetota bacterium]|nr:tyrosine/phenylalanine carboxypeptidase domain-containing protein [Planctomycetota bacterium]